MIEVKSDVGRGVAGVGLPATWHAYPSVHEMRVVMLGFARDASVWD